MFFFLKQFYLFMYFYFWRCQVFIAVWAFLELWQVKLLSSCDAQLSHCSGFSCCGARALGHVGFSSFSSQSLELPRWHRSKKSACQEIARDECLIPGSGRSPGRWNCNLLQYSFLVNPMDRGAGAGGAWRATVHRVTKSQTQLSIHMHAHKHTRA